ncbi:uncharacterized protein VTP21DRAFT_2564 [Calcarisporiella thermophila]|uniref:uncharacterized protein n=1 Tax=Calcarisporiella thermophila TaxID=911321 RepID=UPI0037447339
MKLLSIRFLSLVALATLAIGTQEQVDENDTLVNNEPNVNLGKREIRIHGSNEVGLHQQIGENNHNGTKNDGDGSGSLNQNINKQNQKGINSEEISTTIEEEPISLLTETLTPTPSLVYSERCYTSIITMTLSCISPPCKTPDPTTIVNCVL